MGTGLLDQNGISAGRIPAKRVSLITGANGELLVPGEHGELLVLAAAAGQSAGKVLSESRRDLLPLQT